MDYGTTKYDGKEYIFAQQAYYNAGNGMYQANVTDEGGNLYIAYFEILDSHEFDENEDTMCDWDNATGIEFLGTVEDF